MTADPDKIIPDTTLSIKQGAIHASGWFYYEGGIATMYYEGLAKHYKFSLDTPFCDLPQKIRDIILYGSNCEINTIDLDKCKPYKDFGQAFYLTTLLSQAKEMANKVAERFGGSPVVNVFELDPNKVKELVVKEFKLADHEWAEFVMTNRSRSVQHPADFYDLIIGPVANDDIATLFRTYTMGIITINDLVHGLKYRKLNNQYAFRTAKAIALLQKRNSV